MAERKGRGRPTISEIAERAGVSTGAVSFALNGRPGVSDETRARIVQIAKDVGWAPSNAARALRGGGSATVGLVIAREPEVLGVEPFFMSFVGGIESVITDEGYALMLQVTPDAERAMQTYREWWSARRVDGVFVTDLEVDDARVALVNQLEIPAVVVGDPAYAGGQPAVASNDATAAQAAVTKLAELGHTRIGHIGGPTRYVHSVVRSEAMRAAAAKAGVAIAHEASTDYSFAAGSAACETMLAAAEPPTAIVCDNDLTALGAVQAATRAGVEVPRDLSVLAWDDSPLCELTVPPISALGRDVAAYGAAAARALLAHVKGDELPGETWASVATLVDRGSLAPTPSL